MTHQVDTAEPVFNTLSELELRLAQLNERFVMTKAECERLRQELAIVAPTQISHKSESLSQLLESFGAQIFSLPDVDGGAINLVNESGDALVSAHLQLPNDFSGVQNGYRGFQYHFDQPDINIQVFQTGTPEIVFETDLHKYAETTRMRFERWRMCNLMVLPFFIRHTDGSVEIIGTISVFSQQRPLHSEMTKEICVLAEQYAVQIQTQWNHHQAVQRRKVVGAMSANIQQFFTCVSEINNLDSVEKVYASIATKFLTQFRFDLFSMLLAEDGALELAHMAFSDSFSHLLEPMMLCSKDVNYSFNVSDGQAGFVYTHNQHFLIDDVMKIRHLPMSEKDKSFVDQLQTLRTLLIVPIRLENAVIGTITLATLADTINLSETDLTLIELLASFISTAIRNAKAHGLVRQESSEMGMVNQDLQCQMVLLDQASRKDSLTGLNNFGNFEEELQRRISEYSRADSENKLSVILVDVDHFKRFNDAWGHPAGNQVLQEVAARMRECAREMDFVARYGGEEFVMLLPQCDLVSANAIADRIRCRIVEDVFVIDGKHHTISISGGCAQYVQNESSRDFIYRVDTALYRAKRSGRNCIRDASELPGQSVG